MQPRFERIFFDSLPSRVNHLETKLKRSSRNTVVKDQSVKKLLFDLQQGSSV